MKSFLHFPQVAVSFLLVLAAVLAGCDSLQPVEEEPAEEVGGLRFFYAPLASGPTGTSARGHADAEPPSPYSCLTSVRTPGGPNRYRYQQVYLLFPEDILAEVPELTMRYDYRFHVPGLDGEAPAMGGAIGRMARCVLPIHEDAVRMAVDALNYKEGAVVVLVEGESEEASRSAEAESLGAKRAAATSSDLINDVRDWAEDIGLSCTEFPDDDEWSDPDPVIAVRPGSALSSSAVAGASLSCKRTEVVVSDDGGGGSSGGFGGSGGSGWGGSGGDGGGDNPDPCAAGGTYDYICGGGGDIGDETLGDDAGWGKAVKIGRKMIAAARRGENLLDARTWKKMLDSKEPRPSGRGIRKTALTVRASSLRLRGIQCSAG